MRPNPFPIAHTITPAVFGSGNDIRFWSFGTSPQPEQGSTGYPYAVWQHVVGLPYNSMNCPPSLAQNTIQIDIYAKTPKSLLQAVDATFTAFADAGTVNSFNNWPREAQTDLYRYTLEVDLN